MLTSCAAVIVALHELTIYFFDKVEGKIRHCWNTTGASRWFQPAVWNLVKDKAILFQDSEKVRIEYVTGGTNLNLLLLGCFDSRPAAK